MLDRRFMVGFSRVNVTPPLGINITGYFKVRLADGILDDLEINSIAFSYENKKMVMMAIDNCGITQKFINEIAEGISFSTGLPTDAIFIHSTHTHTGPLVIDSIESTPDHVTSEIEIDYYKMLKRKFVDSATLALSDLKPAKMGYGVSKAPNISFIRRFKMKDGSTATNPGPDNPDIIAPIGDVDENVIVYRFDRENADSVVLVNFGDHPDTVGGNKITADWPGFTRRILERSLDNVKVAFFNGAQGDVNHVNVHPRGGFNNDMFLDFDDVMRGYGHARHMGNVVAGAVLQIFDKVEYVNVDSIKYLQREIKIPSNMPKPEELPIARKYNELHQADKDSEIPYKGMALTTVVARSERMLALENGPEFFKMKLTGFAIGNIAFIGIPGEPFTGIGTGLKGTEGWTIISPCCLTNGSEGYFPMKDAYDEGGYESESSYFKSGVAELIIEEGKSLLEDLKK